MTNQFSPEYIEYILSDEAKALQHPLPDLRGAWIAIVRPGHGTVEIRNLGEKPHQTLQALMDIVDVPGKYWLWLPTLFQLLRIIEGAGVRCIIMAPSESHPYWTVDAGLMEFNERDLLLAAAQLAVRAVEGKE